MHRSQQTMAFFQGGHFPVLIKFPDFSLTFPDVYDIPASGDSTQIGLGVLVIEQESMCEHIVHSKLNHEQVFAHK